MNANGHRMKGWSAGALVLALAAVGSGEALAGPRIQIDWSVILGPSRAPSTGPVNAGRGAIRTRVTPKRAEVWVDGVPVGQARDYNGTWDVLWLSPGQHVLEFGAAGYRDLRLNVTIHAGTTEVIEERLIRGEGHDPRSDPLPEPAQPPAVVPAQSPPPAPLEEDDAAPSLQDTRSGLLWIEASPPDAAVYLDGEFLARADELERMHGPLPVSQGEHTIEVMRPGYAGETLQVEVLGNEPVQVSVRLSRDSGLP